MYREEILPIHHVHCFIKTLVLDKEQRLYAHAENGCYNRFTFLFLKYLSPCQFWNKYKYLYLYIFFKHHNAYDKHDFNGTNLFVQ